MKTGMYMEQNGMTKEYATSWGLYICGNITNDRGQCYEDQAK